MEIKIPTQDGKIYQANEGDLKGNVWGSWNMDFLSSPGKIRVSPKTLVRLTNLSNTTYAITGQYTGDTDFSQPLAFVMSNADGTQIIWACCANYMFHSYSSAPTIWKQDTKTDSPTTIDSYSDMTEFNGHLIVSLPTSVSYLSNLTNTWGANYGSITLTTGIPHPTCVSFNNLLLTGNGNYVTSTTTTPTTDATAITLGPEYEVTWIRSSNSLIFIGTRNKKGGRAKVFTWDGYSENFIGDYKINGQYSLAGVVNKEICYTINECGELLAFTGGGFEQVAKFPNFDRQFDISVSSSYPSFKNCMATQNDNIYILFGTDFTAPADSSGNVMQIENMPAGVWCYNEKVGLHHVYSLNTYLGDSLSTDYGKKKIDIMGAIYPLTRTSGGFLIGAGITPNYAESSKYYAMTLRNEEFATEITGEGTKVGYFITPKIQTQALEENWQKVFLIIKELINATDKIVVKYRTTDEDIVPAPATCVWTSTTTLTSTNTQFANAVAGDEMEILNGEGSGLSTHITTITYSNPTYTITIEDTVPYASGSVQAVVWNWTKLGTISTQSQKNFELGLGVNSSWVQFKVVCFFQGKNEIEKFIIKSEPQLKII